MTTYTWTARNKEGEQVVREVQANTPEEAREKLLAQGFTEPALKFDDIDDAVRNFRPDPKAPNVGNLVNPQARVKHLDNPQQSQTIASAMYRGMMQTRGVFFMVTAVGIYELYRRDFRTAMIVGSALMIWLIIMVQERWPAIAFNRMHRALDWHRWQEVLKLAAQLEKINQSRPGLISPFYPALCRAKAMAAAGKISEAVALFQPWENQTGCPGWMHKMFMATLYNLARDYDTAIVYREKSIEEKPTATGYIDLASGLARYKKDPAKARVALAAAEKLTFPDQHKPFYLRCRGIIAYLEKNDDAARRDLEQAAELVERARNGPYRDGQLAMIRSYLCCVLARKGERTAAKKLLDQATKYLVATKEDQLLAECRRAVGVV